MAESPTAARAGIGPARLYGRLVGAEVRSTAEYPASFLFGVLTSGALTMLELVAVLAVFGNVESLAGWTLTDALVLYGMAQTSFALADLFVGHLDDLPAWIRSGRLDTLLLRPRRVLFQVLAGEVDLRSLGKLLQGGVVLAVALAGAGVTWSPARALLLRAGPARGRGVRAAVPAVARPAPRRQL